MGNGPEKEQVIKKEKPKEAPCSPRQKVLVESKNKRDRLKFANSIEKAKEQPEWNKEIIPTFDGNPTDTAHLIQYLEERKITNYRFYIDARHEFKDDTLYAFGLEAKDGKPLTSYLPEKVTPGSWYDYLLTQSAAQKLKPKEYMQKYMLKPKLLKEGKKVKALLRKYYGPDYLKKLNEIMQYHASVVHAGAEEDTRTNIQYWTPDQVKKDIRFFEIFVKAWLDLDDYQVSRLRTPLGSGFNDVPEGSPNTLKLQQAAKDLNPEAKWDSWRTDSRDWLTLGGTVKKRGMTAKNVASDIIRYRKTKRGKPNEPDQALVLFHSIYYRGDKGKILLDKYMNSIKVEYDQAQKASKVEN